MRIRLGYAAELVVVMASGMALTRSTLGDPSLRRYLGADSTDLPGILVVDASLTGVAIAGGLGLAIEAARRRSPTEWGVGRWCWAVAGLTVVLRAAGISLASGLPSWGQLGRRPFDTSAALFYARLSVAGMFSRGLGDAFAAAGIVAILARRPRADPDAREWSGRVLLATISGLALAYPVLRGLVE